MKLAVPDMISNSYFPAIAAIEPSIDFDWIRLRASALYSSGDGDPFDNV